MAFRGTFEHSLDNRGRLAVPARYRDAFAEGGVVTKGPDACLELYTAAEFERMGEQLSGGAPHQQRSRRLRRAFYSSAFDVELDRQGRILIPAPLRETAGLSGQAVLVGRFECIEIWSPPRWQTEYAVADREFAANLEASGRTEPPA